MVLCKNFQQGYCRFGSKCNFEHLDIKQLVKNDIESAINGKQYPFSCYGPFKDKPCVPNFVEDQSFEEVRLMYLEARQKNCVDQFHQLFSLGATEAMNKMKALLQPNYEIMNIITTIYDTPVGANSNIISSTNNNSATSNPFGVNKQTNDGGASSIFGKSSIPASSVGNNVFGGGIFGGGANTNNNTFQSGNIFGAQNSLGTQQQQQQPQQGSIFGQQPQQGNVGSLFGGVAKPTLFSQQQTTNPVGGVSSFFGQTAQKPAFSFNQQTNFGQQQPQQQQQIVQSQPPPGFFSQSGFNQPQNQQNIGAFGSSQLQQQPQTQNLFVQSAQSTAVGANPYFNNMQQNNLVGPPPGFFQQTTQQMGMQQQIQQQQQQQQMSQQPQDLTRMQIPPQMNYAYSRLEDLTPAEIEAFKADTFEPGKLPFSPPPKELLG